LSIEQQRTKTVFAVMEKLTEQGQDSIRAGDIATWLRDQSRPMPVWEIRGELTRLDQAGLIVLDVNTGAWRLAARAASATGSRKAG
jgi:hypothetical protein